ncbi:hypothetical protein [Tardiphaga sp.]|uniref:hypothetical protein n=1 Tax=Tardiphaga sp. TaxID=1926292 RepID=UPI00260D9983|nr:hypothetical protein [Tardiphaga sp.]
MDIDDQDSEPPRVSNAKDAWNGLRLVTEQQVSFEVRAQDAPLAGWIIIAQWPNGREEQLVGVFTDKQFANLWIKHQSQIFIRHRNAELE